MGKRRASVVLLLTLLVVLAAGLTAAAQPDTPDYEINVWRRVYEPPEGPLGMTTDQSVELRAGWAGNGWFLTRMGIGALTFDVQVTKDGAPYLHLWPYETARLWDPIGPREIQDPNCEPLGFSRPVGSWWRVSLDGLEPGEYHVTTRIILAFPVIDGYDCDGDGRPDVVYPSDVSRETTNVIVVGEP
jgi:hypothetical protein